MDTRRAEARGVRWLLMGLIPVLLGAPASATEYSYLPSESTDDARMLSLAGADYYTLCEEGIRLILAVPPGVASFELGVFDGDTGGLWDHGSTPISFQLFYDPYQQLSTAAPAAAPWSGAAMPDDAWHPLMVSVPAPSSDPLAGPAPGESPSGWFFYHLQILYPQQGDPNPATVSNFKLRVERPVRMLARHIGIEGGLHGPEDARHIYDVWGPWPTDPGFWADRAQAGLTTYDGSWSLELEVPHTLKVLDLWDGDFDFGTYPATEYPEYQLGYPSGYAVASCGDSDDLDSPPLPEFVKPWKKCCVANCGGDPSDDVMEDCGSDDSLVQGAAACGWPAEDNFFDLYRRGGCAGYRLIDPDGRVYANTNPSSHREWERFCIVHSSLVDPGKPVAEQADHVTTDLLPAGTWRLEVEGLDLSNLARLDTVYNTLPGYLIGDTVWHDVDGDGVQQPGEAGIPGVVMRVRDENGALLGSRDTGDAMAYPNDAAWLACRRRNTGGNPASGGWVDPIDETGLYCHEAAVIDRDPQAVDTALYTVEVAAESLAWGGAVYDFLDGVPVATTPSPLASRTLAEGDGPRMTFDFGYRLGGGQGCTPGFWKQPQHLALWPPPFAPDDLFVDVFGVGPAQELIEALKTGGGGQAALNRHAVAALLNASRGDVDYRFAAAHVIAMVQAAYADGSYEATKDRLVPENEAGCPLGATTDSSARKRK